MQNILIALILLIVLVLVMKFINMPRHQEGFQDIGNAIDLLTRIKSADSQSRGDSNSADLEFTINPWTTKLHNLQSNNPVKAIGFYKPHLVINKIGRAHV